MTKTTRNNFITALLVILWIFIGMMVASCASTNLEKGPDGTIKWSSTTLWKDVGSVQAEAGDINFKLGSSASVEDLDSLITTACVLRPELPACQ